MNSQFDDEALVAYLDGELAAEQVQLIDSQIATNPDLRNRINQLRMTWDMLDELPVEPPSPRFAETTLEMAAISTAAEPQSLWAQLAKNAGRIVVFLLPLLFLGGYFSSQYAQHRADRQLLRDLPILVDLRSLANIDSLEWLDVLVDQPDLVDAFAGEDLGLIGDGDIPIEINQRSAWLEKLDDADRGRLSANLSEFRQRTPERQTELRKIITKVYSEPKTKEKYLAALRAYELLLKEQNMTTRAELYDMPLEDRRSELGHIVSIHMANQFAKSISPADAQAVRDWADEITKRYLIAYNPDSLQSLLYEFKMKLSTTEITFSDFEDLASRLSDRAQAILGGLNSSDAYVYSLIDWIEAVAIPPEQSAERAGPEKLKDIYMNLSGPKQDEIDVLQPEQAKAALRKLNKPRSPLPSNTDS